MRLMLALLLLSAALTPATEPPPPEPTRATAVPLPGGGWRLSWQQRSDAPAVVVSAGAWRADLPGAAEHTVVAPWPAAANWRPALGLTVFERWPASPRPDEIYVLPVAELSRAVYLPALDAAAEPAPARAPPRLHGLHVVRTKDTLTAAWRPVAGTALACAFRISPRPQEPLEPCLRGGGGVLRLAVPRDVGLLVGVGDTVEVRAWDSRGNVLAQGRAEIAEAWRVYFPWAEWK